MVPSLYGLIPLLRIYNPSYLYYSIGKELSGAVVLYDAFKYVTNLDKRCLMKCLYIRFDYLSIGLSNF